MTFIFIDESGDLGMKSASKHFVLAAVLIDKDAVAQDYARIVKKVRQRTLKKTIKELPEIKFSNSPPLTREQYLSRVAKLDVKIYAIIINKKFTYQRLRDNLPALYNYLIKVLLEKALSDAPLDSELTISLDRCMSQAQRDNFETYITTIFLDIFRRIPKYKIVHENSLENNSLQVTDFVVGAFGHKYNYDLKGTDQERERYSDIIKTRTIIEKNDLFKEKTNPAYLS